MNPTLSEIFAVQQQSDATDTSWASKIAAHLDVVDARLAQHLSDAAGSATLDEPWGIDAAALLADLLTVGGKRIRPMLTYAGWIAAGGGPEPDVQAAADYDVVVRASCAVELLHLFALVHDDVMDQSRVRRGRPTLHRAMAELHATRSARTDHDRFGESIAVLVGDLAHAEAEQLAAGLPAELRQIWQLLTRELVTGQMYDLCGTAAADSEVAFALEVARLKSGNYTVMRPLQLGAAAAHAGTATFEALARYGRSGGEAFALRDEVLGVFGDSARTGKSADDDLRDGKPTVLSAMAAEMLRGPAADALARAGTVRWSAEDLDLLRLELVAQGVVDRLETMISERVAQALAAITPEAVSGAGIELLDTLLDDVADRGR